MEDSERNLEPESTNVKTIGGNYEVSIAPEDIKKGRYTTVYKASKDNAGFSAIEEMDDMVSVEERDEILKAWGGKGVIGRVPGSPNSIRYERVGSDSYYFVHTDKFEDIVPVELHK